MGVESSKTIGLVGRYDNSRLAACSDYIDEEAEAEDKELDAQDTDRIEGMIPKMEWEGEK